MRVAVQCGAVDVAGSIAAMMVNAFNALDRIDAGEPRCVVIDDTARRHQAIANYFFEREQETTEFELRQFECMTLQEWAQRWERCEALVQGL